MWGLGFWDEGWVGQEKGTLAAGASKRTAILRSEGCADSEGSILEHGELGLGSRCGEELEPVLAWSL